MKREDVIRDTNSYYLNAKDYVSPELLTFAHGNAGYRVLDVGCATGEYAKKLKELGHEVVGVDLNPEYVKAARSNGIETYVLDARSLSSSFPEKSFDTVILFEVLEHVGETDEVLDQAKKVARKNILITVPDCTGIDELKKQGLTFEHMLEKDHVNFFTRQDVETLLKKHFHSFVVNEREPLYAIKSSLPLWLYYPIAALYKLHLIRPHIYYRLYANVIL